MTVESETPPTETVETPPIEETPKPRQEIPAEVTASLRKANKEAETLRLKLKEYEDRDKSEVDRLTERATAAEARATELEKSSLRDQVALAKGLSPVLAKRLQGSTQEELEADADELLKLAGPATEPTTPKVPDLGQGHRAGSTAPSVQAGEDLYASRHKKKT